MPETIALSRIFERPITEKAFVEESFSELGDLGFKADNAIACVSLCRDEIAAPLAAHVRDAWGEAFNLSALAGMFFVGKTGLAAALHHAPQVDGRHRTIFYALPHVAVGTGGQVGLCCRKGLRTSRACGALCIFLDELKGGTRNLSVDRDDLEMGLLRVRLLQEIPDGRVPDLLELTRIAQRIIVADLERAIEAVVERGTGDHAIVTGIQIHAPDGNYVEPLPSYAVVGGSRRPLKLGHPG